MGDFKRRFDAYLTNEFGFCFGLHRAGEAFKIKKINGKMVAVSVLRLGYIIEDLTLLVKFSQYVGEECRQRREDDKAAGRPVDVAGARKDRFTRDVPKKDRQARLQLFKDVVKACKSLGLEQELAG